MKHFCILLRSDIYELGRWWGVLIIPYFFNHQ